MDYNFGHEDPVLAVDGSNVAFNPKPPPLVTEESVVVTDANLPPPLVQRLDLPSESILKNAATVELVDEIKTIEGGSNLETEAVKQGSNREIGDMELLVDDKTERET